MTKTTGGKSDPRVVEAINHAFDLDSKDQTELAVQHLSALIKEFPTEGRIHAYLALFLYRSGRFDEAIEHGRKAVQLSPKSGTASAVLHGALWKTGKRIEALVEMKRLLAIRPTEVYSKMIEQWSLGEDVESAIEKAKRAIRQDDRQKAG
jgi:tetratricopeptide (TPR) repeat protein